MLSSKKPDIADIVLTSGTSGAAIGIVEVAKDPSKTHPHRQKEIIATVNSALDGASPINYYDVQCVIKVYEIRKRPEFFYKGAVQGSPSQYSQEFADWLLRQYRNDNAFFAKARQQAKSNVG